MDDLFATAPAWRLRCDGGARGNPGPAAYGYVLESDLTTIGDHVMCTAIGLALDVGFPGDPLRDPRCATWLGEPDVNPTTQLPN